MATDDFDRERLLLALSGDAAAVRALVEFMTPVVRARVGRALARRAAGARRDVMAELSDFTQEVFVGLFSADAKALRAWDPARGLSLRNFVGLLAQHRVAEIMRQRRWQVQVEEIELDESQLRSTTPDARGDLEAASAHQQRLTRVLEYLELKLSDRGLEMFQRLFVQGQSVESICAETGATPDAVYQWRTRLAKLAREGIHEAEQAGAKKLPLPQAAVGPTARRRT